MTTFKFLEVEITEDINPRKALWNASKGVNVEVVSRETGVRINFDYFGGSQADLNELSGLYALLSDAIDYINCLDYSTVNPRLYLADMLGYEAETEEDIEKLDNIVEGLEENYNKAMELVYSEDELYDLMNELNELGF